MTETTETPKERGRRAVLKKAQVNEVFRLLLEASSPGNRQVEKRINAAEAKLAILLNPKMGDRGNITWDDGPETAEYWFNEFELFGIKTAFVQGIRGSQTRAPVTHGIMKYLHTPILKELGILSGVLKETKEGDSSEDFSITFDGEEESAEEGAPLETVQEPAPTEVSKEEPVSS